MGEIPSNPDGQRPNLRLIKTDSVRLESAETEINEKPQGLKGNIRRLFSRLSKPKSELDQLDRKTGGWWGF